MSVPKGHVTATAQYELPQDKNRCKPIGFTQSLQEIGQLWCRKLPKFIVDALMCPCVVKKVYTVDNEGKIVGLDENTLKLFASIVQKSQELKEIATTTNHMAINADGYVLFFWLCLSLSSLPHVFFIFFFSPCFLHLSSRPFHHSLTHTLSLSSFLHFNFYNQYASCFQT